MRELEEIRTELDQVDREIVALFEKRMKLARDAARFKMARNLPVLDSGREEIVLASRVSMLEDGYWAKDVRVLYGQIMALSRAEQEKILREGADNA